MSQLTAQLSSLLGVFLDDSVPSLSAAPGGLDFSGAGAIDFTSLSPALKQVFFIGDGLTSGSAVQSFVVPSGATRLYLGTMDGFEWINNEGSLEVTVSAVPEPAAVALVLSGLALLPLIKRCRN